MLNRGTPSGGLRSTVGAIVTGLTTAVLLCAFGVQASAATNAPQPAPPQTAAQSGAPSWDVIVACLAGLAMFGAACGVIAYTALHRHSQH